MITCAKIGSGAPEREEVPGCGGEDARSEDVSVPVCAAGGASVLAEGGVDAAGTTAAAGGAADAASANGSAGTLDEAGAPDTPGAPDVLGPPDSTGGGAVEYPTRAESVSGIPGGASVTR